MTHFQAYLLTRLDSLGSFFGAIGGISFGIILAGTIVGLVVYGSEYDDENRVAGIKIIVKINKVAIPLALIFCFISALIPTTKEAAFIYIAPAIVNNVDVQKTVKQLPELSGLGLEYLNELLKEEIKLKKEK